VFWVWGYGFFGFIANFALGINILMIFGVLSLFGATLTLPGIAGIVLTVGMAVDANVLIFERIREEMRRGKKVLASIDVGYSRAVGTIVDANVTTLIAALILFQFGSGPVKGFAVTLAAGIITSVFTAVSLSRLIIVTWARNRRPTTLKL
jgi:protein-export membrane protein SecD